MEAFKGVSGIAVIIPQANIDTDIIFPARFLLITEKVGLGRYAFYEWRYDAAGKEIPDFVLNQKPFKRAEILIAGDNFGCGSSREQAPWALRDLGIRCIISSSFGEIFYSNCLKNGLLPVVVTPSQLDELMADADTGYTLEVSLSQQIVRRHQGDSVPFLIEGWRRDALLNGWDEIAITENTHGAEIARFEQSQRQSKPWLYIGD